MFTHNMFYLSIGYIVVQFYAVINLLLKETISPYAMLFSIVVLIIYSFLPIIGYLLGRSLFSRMLALRRLATFELIGLGFSIGLIEKLLFFANILHYKQTYIAITLTSFLFFIVPLVKSKPMSAHK